MLRMLRPYLAIATAITVAVATAYAFGAPAWVVYAGTLVAVFAVLPGYVRWDQQQHP